VAFYDQPLHVLASALRGSSFANLIFL